MHETLSNLSAFSPFRKRPKDERAHSEARIGDSAKYEQGVSAKGIWRFEIGL